MLFHGRTFECLFDTFVKFPCTIYSGATRSREGVDPVIDLDLSCHERPYVRTYNSDERNRGTRSRFNSSARRCWRRASHARPPFFSSSSSRFLFLFFARQPPARHFLFTAACEYGLKRARSRRRLDLTALSYGGPLDSTPRSPACLPPSIHSL